jgi:hypothetical protein
MATRTASLSSTIRLMESSSPSATSGQTSKPRKPSTLDRWALRLARALLRWRVSRQWREVEEHIDHCPRRQCQWWRQNGIPENQEDGMFCHAGNKLWARNFDMSSATESLD